MVSKKSSPVIKREVTLGQLIGIGISLFIIICTSWVNLNIRLNTLETNMSNTKNIMDEIKQSLKENQAASNVILQEIGSLKAQVDDLQRHNDIYGESSENKK